LPEGLPVHLADYLERVNRTGRAVGDDKRGAIADDLPPILELIGVTAPAWLQLTAQLEEHFCSWIGPAEHVEEACRRGGHRWARGIGARRRLFQTGEGFLSARTGCSEVSP